MTLIANAISCLVDMHRKFTDPRIARKVSYSDGLKTIFS
jgi:hypothetical protein